MDKNIQMLKEDYLSGRLTTKSVEHFGRDILKIIDGGEDKMTIEVSTRELENIIRALNVADEYYPWLESDMKILMDKLMNLYERGGE